MKRILSVILSLALLASLLIIPMSVSAGVEDNSVTTTEFSNSDAGTYYSKANNLARGITPFVFVTDNRDENNPTRTNKTVNGTLSDGNTGNGGDIALGFEFRNPNTEGKYLGDYLNGYKEYVQEDDSTHFDFNKNANQYDAYADIIYDLGTTAAINKVQQFGPDGDARFLSIGAYQVYASADINTLFDAESLVLNYQNKTSSADLKSCQQHEFANRNARFVAFRIYCPVTRPVSGWQTTAIYYNTLRIKELAIYGTKTSGYKVTEIQAPSAETTIVAPDEFAEKGNLLSQSNLTVTGKDGNDDKTFEMKETDHNHLSRFINGKYVNEGHADFRFVTFFADDNFKNGYKLVTNTDGSIDFRDAEQPITNYVDFTYELDSYYKLSQFELYSTVTKALRVQAYEIYLSADRDDLYSADNKVAEYNNYFNTYGQKFEFNQKYTGKYLGVRILMAGSIAADYNYVRLDEMVAYGEEVGTPPVIQVEDGATCGSAVVTVTDVNANLKSVIVNDVEKVTDENKEAVKAKYEETLNKGEYTVVATDDKGNVTTEKFTVADHNYQYTADGAVITETCANCGRPAKTLTLTKPETIVYDGNDKSGSIDAVKIEGFANAVNEANIVFEKDGKPVDPAEVKNAGNYVAKLTIGNATAVLPFTIQQANLDPQDYPAPTVDDIEAGSILGSEPFGANEKGAFTWAEPDTKVEYGSHTYKATFTPTNDNYKTVENIDVTVNGKDTTAPTGEIKIKETVWDKLANLFIKDRETVTITGSDAGSGVKAVYYYVADAAVDTATIEESAWKPYTDPFKIEKEGNNFVYAKIVDVAGKVTVISTDGIVLDTKAPSADVTNLGKYYGSLTVTVKDDNLDTVKLNGKDVTLEDGKFTVSAADKEQTIVITDMAGNETTYTVTVVEVKGFNPAEGKLTVDMDEKNVDKEKIAEKIEKGETVTFFDISVDNATGSTANVLEVPVDFDFTGKLNVRVLHNHGGNVNELKALTARPTAGFENGTFFADKENGKLYIYSKEFSPFAVAFHVHDVKHVEAKAATAEADGNIEYWYCEGCDKYFSDAAATKEIQKADTVVKYVAPSNGNTGSGSNAPTTGGETENNATVPGGTSPVTGETAMTVVLFAILLGAIAVMGISIVKSRKAKSK